MSYHKIIIVGYLGGDPQLRYTPSGSPVCNFSVATNRKHTTSTGGEQAEETTWFRVTAWGSLGERCNEFLSKGRLVLVEGALTPDKATGGPRVFARGDGTAGASYEVKAHTVKFLGGARPEAEDGQDELPF